MRDGRLLDTPKGGAMSTSIILVLVWINVMMIVTIIIIGGMIEDNYRMNSRKKNHLLLMHM